MKSLSAIRSQIVGLTSHSGILLLICLALLAIAPSAGAAVVINEINYHPVSDDDGEEFLELYNPDASSVNLQNWCVDGIGFCFGAGASIPANGYVILAKDAVKFQAKYGFAPGFVYTGQLSNSGEVLTLRNASQQVIDQVGYDDVGPWSPLADGEGPSLERIDPAQAGNTPRNWRACTNPSGHTVAAMNSVSAVGLPPWISEVAHTENVAALSPIVVTARVEDATSVSFTYRIDFGADVPGTMFDDGAHNDGGSGDGIYGAEIPGQAVNTLVRYFISATGPTGSMRYPRTDDTINYSGTVVQDLSLVTDLPVFQWFMDPVDYQHAIDHKFTDLTEPAIFAYQGVIFDNVQVRVRGQTSRSWPKNHWKFDLPRGHDFHVPALFALPVDQFDLQCNYSDKSYVREILSYETFRDAGHPYNQAFHVRLQQNGQFYGLYNFLETMDDDYITRNGLDENGAWYKADDDCRPRPLNQLPNEYEKQQRELEDYSDLFALLDGVNNLSGAARHNFLFDNVNIPNMINYIAAQCIVHNNDHVAKNFYLYRDTEGTGRWTMHTWDMDLTFGRNFGAGGGVLSDGIWADDDAPHPENPFVSPSHPLFADSNHRKWDNLSNYFIHAVLDDAQARQMYFRRLRTLADALLPTGRYEDRIDELVSHIGPEAVLDVAKWGQYGVPQTLSEAVNILKTEYLAVRRVHLLTTHRVAGEIPEAQSAAPVIVINEIMYRPAGDDTLGEFVELHNPSATEAVDVSGWRLDGVGLSLPAGVVILPNNFVIVARNDVGFRGVYGGGKFVGAQYSGELSNDGEKLTLRDAAGQLVDEVSFDDVAPWATSADGGGMSLERIDATQPGSLPANWAASLVANGTPAAPNSRAGTFSVLTGLHVNEVLPVNTSIIRDDNNEFAPFIELYNSSSATINLSGLYLTDNYGQPSKWPFPSGTQLCAGEWLLVWADNQPGQGPLHTNFSLSAAGGSVGIYDSMGVLVDYLNYPALTANRSYGRYPDASSSLAPFATPTPSTANFAAANAVILNEYNAVLPTGFIKNNASDTFFGRIVGNGGDWFELVVTQNHADLRGWQLVAIDNPGPSQTIHTLILSNHAIWSDLRAGTIITVCESVPDDISYDPLGGDWWINVRAGPSGTGTYVSAIDFEVDQRNWQLTIKNDQGQVMFGPAGEGVQPASGIGNDEVFKLEEDPTEYITPLSNYNDGSSSTFGSPNLFNSGTQSQDFGALRSQVFACDGDVDCSDGNPCTSDSCLNGECYHTAAAPCYQLSLDVVGSTERCPGAMDIRLNLTGLVSPINGAQVLLHYDTARLSLQSITPGDGVSSPWNSAMPIAFSDTGGDVIYALALFGGSASIDATVATLHFNVLGAGGDLSSTQVVFDTPQSCSPLRTKLTTVVNETILPTTMDSDLIGVGPRVIVNIDIEGLSHAVTRDVTFILTNCSGLVTQTLVEPVAFDASGLGVANLTGISTDASWICVYEGHTLRKRMPLSFSSCFATVECTGANQLLAGDFQTVNVPQDNFVDIVDFSILAARWGTVVSDCVSGTPASCSYGADANGDGIQETADFTAIQINYFIPGDEAHACPPPPPVTTKGRQVVNKASPAIGAGSLGLGASIARSSIGAAELPPALGASPHVDLNGDGIVDATDIRAFARARGLQLLPQFEAKLRSLESNPRDPSR